MVEKLTPKQIEEMLHGEVIGRIGCYGEGKVYVVPVTYAYDGVNIYGFTQEGQKVKMMRENPNICFEIDQMQNMVNWKSVIIQGNFEELEGDDRKKALIVLKNRIMPFLVNKVSEEGIDSQSVVYRIKILKKSGRYEER